MDANTLEGIGQIICGTVNDFRYGPIYRRGNELGGFFERAGIPGHEHDGSQARMWFVGDVLRSLDEQQIEKVLLRLMNPREYQGNRTHLRDVKHKLNDILYIEEKRVDIRGAEPYIEDISPDFSELDSPSEPKGAIQIPKSIADQTLLGVLNFWNAEYQKCAGAGAFLASVVLLGAMLEAALYLAICKHPEKANKSPTAPKQNDRVKPFNKWTLSEMINVACALGWVGSDVKKLNDLLRDYRNCIHPRELMKENNPPDKDIVDICARILQSNLRRLDDKGLLK